MEQTNELVSRFRELQALLDAYDYATTILYTDGVTVAPKGSAAARGRAMASLSGVTYELQTGPSTVALLKELNERADELDPITRRAAGEM